jgi:hypothetical protein
MLKEFDGVVKMHLLLLFRSYTALFLAQFYDPPCTHHVLHAVAVSWHKLPWHFDMATVYSFTALQL